MRTVTYGAACSLDGYIAGSGGAIDWLHFSRDVEDIMAEYWTTVDAILMGRKTWEFAAAQGMGGEADPGSRSASNEATGIPPVATYILSRTLKESPPGVELVSADAAGFVKQLRRRATAAIRWRVPRPSALRVHLPAPRHRLPRPSPPPARPGNARCRWGS
ncbi:RibD C-terminal domain-containing protein [Arthrobacter sp. P2b]|nr:RibD C-terminal domain-containing protein [Arthrobacter sp. P2b]